MTRKRLYDVVRTKNGSVRILVDPDTKVTHNLHDRYKSTSKLIHNCHKKYEKRCRKSNGLKLSNS